MLEEQVVTQRPCTEGTGLFKILFLNCVAKQWPKICNTGFLTSTESFYILNNLIITTDFLKLQTQP